MTMNAQGIAAVVVLTVAAWVWLAIADAVAQWTGIHHLNPLAGVAWAITAWLWRSRPSTFLDKNWT